VPLVKLSMGLSGTLDNCLVVAEDVTYITDRDTEVTSQRSKPGQYKFRQQ
jgi:hypothetical protein